MPATQLPTARPSPTVLEVAGVALLVVLPGFVAMALLGSLRTYPGGLPGFWDYPSGTLGDAILVPAIIAGLFTQSRKLRAYRSGNDHILQMIGFLIGAIGGAAVPLSWLLDAHTHRIWLLPRPHYFVLAGWWHFAYLTLTTGALGALILTTLGRLRRSPAIAPGRLPTGYSPTTMLVVTGAGLGMLVLIGRDALIGGRTAASATTLVSLVLVGGIFLAGLSWATRRVLWSRLWMPAAVVSVFLVGLVAVIVRWPPHVGVIVALGTLAAGLATLAATSRLSKHHQRAAYRWPTAAAMTSVLAGGLVRSIDGLFRGEAKPLFWLVGSLLIAFSLLSLVERGDGDLPRTVRHGLFAAYCLFMAYLAARLRVPADRSSAGAAISTADVAFDVMVFTLIQARFGDLGESDRVAVAAEYVEQRHPRPESREENGAPGHPRQDDADEDEAEFGAGPVLLDTYLLGIAVAVSLLLLLVLAAGPLQLDHRTATLPSARVLVLVAVLAAGALVALNEILLRWLSKPNPKTDRLGLPRWYAVLPLAAASVWAAALADLLPGHLHLVGLAIPIALIVFAFVLRTLLSTPVLLQTLEPTPGQVLLCTATALSIAFGAFWFVSSGIWNGPLPLRGGWFAGTAVCEFFGTLFVYAAAGLTLAAGLPQGSRNTQFVLSRKATKQYVGLDGGALGIVFFIGEAIPLYAATRDQELHASSLNVIAAMVFLPGLISAVFWGMRNWREWERINELAKRGQLDSSGNVIDSAEAEAALAQPDSMAYTRVLLPVLESHGYNWNAAWLGDLVRARRFRRQIQFNRYAMITLMICGLAYLADILLR
jgi:hypothetical protein